VMAFWIASPSMDPEIFFLSVATLGWDLAVWRLVSTMAISLSAGFITHYLIKNKWLDETKVLRTAKVEIPKGIIYYAKLSFSYIVRKLYRFVQITKEFILPEKQVILNLAEQGGTVCCKAPVQIAEPVIQPSTASCSSCSDPAVGGITEERISLSNSRSFMSRLLKETWNAAFMVVKFMALAFLFTALIKLYIPKEWITGLIGGNDILSVILSAVIGVPFYTSSLAALPLISGLLSQGMAPAAALAFLIAGPTTTFPAMAAVWGLTSRRIFVLYLSFSLIGALVMGFVYLIVCSL
ncbi:MAG TPA: permease, partial [Ignavibacteriaceae bacterium]|nr:permease [Ignavibacteriaceae bacterium]